MTTTKSGKRGKQVKYAPRLKSKIVFFYAKNGALLSIPVWIEDATEDVWIQGHALHALNGVPGLTFACAIANVATDKENAKCFPHSVRYVAVHQSVLIAITKEIRNKRPVAIRYAHSYGQLVSLNDESKSQEMAKTNPEFFERSYHLRIPRKSRHVPGYRPSGRGVGSSHRTIVGKGHYGSLKRAVMAKFIEPQLARMTLLQEAPNSYDRKTTEWAIKQVEKET